MMQHRGFSLYSFLIIFSFIICWSGCENTFDPLEDNDDYHFTMFGALDLSVDTQWVRVMPVMDSLVTTSKIPLDAEVSLIRTSTGDKTVLNDSLFSFRRGAFYAWNFWTTEPLNEEEEYKLIAETSDGSMSSATIHIPSDFPTPKVQYNPDIERGLVFGSGVERLVVADGIYFIRAIGPNGELLPVQEVHVSHIGEINYTEPDNYSFPLDDRRKIAENLGVIPGGFVIVDREVLLASGTSDWPDFTGLSKDQYVLPNLQSNVENGLGVVTGIISKRVPMESCYDEEGGIVACPLIIPSY